MVYKRILCPTIRQNTSLSSDCYSALIQDILCSFMDSVRSNIDRLCRIIYFVTQNLFEDHSAYFRLMMLPKCFPDIHPIENFSYSEDTKSYVKSSTFKYQQPLRRHVSIYPQRSSDHVWNQCHVNLLYFVRLEGIIKQ